MSDTAKLGIKKPHTLDEVRGLSDIISDLYVVQIIHIDNNRRSRLAA